MIGRPVTAMRPVSHILFLAVTSVFAVLIAASLAGCGPNRQQEVAELVVADFSSTILPTDAKAEELLGADTTSRLRAAGVDPVAYCAMLLSGSSLTVENVDVDGEFARAHLTVTARDMTPVVEAYRANLFDQTQSPEGLSYLQSLDEAQRVRNSVEQLLGCIVMNGASRVTTQVDLSLTLSDGVWVAVPSAEFTRALFGGFDPASVLEDISVDQTVAPEADVAFEETDAQFDDGTSWVETEQNEMAGEYGSE